MLLGALNSLKPLYVLHEYTISGYQLHDATPLCSCAGGLWFPETLCMYQQGFLRLNLGCKELDKLDLKVLVPKQFYNCKPNNRN